MKSKFLTRLLLIPMGIAIGLAAQFLFKPVEPKPRILKPYPSDPSEIEIKPGKDAAIDADAQVGLEPLVAPLQLGTPIRLAGNHQVSNKSLADEWLEQFDRFHHDSDAVFHAHGNQVCASGCALSNHPTPHLTRSHFEKLIAGFSVEALDENSKSLEELLFFGPQTARMIRQSDSVAIDGLRLAFLKRQLEYGHASVSIRVVDEHGEVRSYIDPTRVPFDRRHVFDMKANRVQDLVTSGTVKRVGLYHIWVRL